MIRAYLVTTFCLSLLIFFSACSQKQPISLHPDNPHYFLFRGKPTVLIGSTEHYGAVLNLDFDYVKYLDELKSKGLNVTRTFTGFYVEPQGAFGIARNTLAPLEGKLICPWARSNEPGYAVGGNKFDLTKWDEAYFARLKDFIREAGKRDIVVELDLFSNIYDTIQWKLSPLYFTNNINNLAAVKDHKEILSLKHPEIIKIQEQMVEKILTELNDFDNLYYEICNEPYFGDLLALESWEKHMTEFTHRTESKLGKNHLISNNIANGSEKIENLNQGVSIVNFHYAKPPAAVELNYSLNLPVGDNETGFNGIEDVNYRTEAWDFMVAGGALFNNLDYSFATGHEDGSFVVAPGQPGGGGRVLRSQFQLLKNVMDSLDFIQMKPSNELVKNKPRGTATARVLAHEGNQYLLYLNNAIKENTNYSLRYSGFFSSPVTGKIWLYTLSDDGVKLYLNNELLINNWTNHGTTTDSVLVNLKAGEQVPMKLEFFQAGGGAELQLKWKVPGRNMENIPISAFKAMDGKTPGLHVARFSDIELKSPAGELVVSNVNAIGISPSEGSKMEVFNISLELSKGNYTGIWIDPISGLRNSFPINHSGGELELITPSFLEDMALLIRKK